MGRSNRRKLGIRIISGFDVEQPVARLGIFCSTNIVDTKPEGRPIVGTIEFESTVATSSCFHDVQCSAAGWYGNVGDISGR